MRELVIKLLSTTWQYYPDENMLVATLGDSQSLQELSIIEDGNFLNSAFKQAIPEVLGDEMLQGIVGPFGDRDLCSGTDTADGLTSYFVKLCQANEETVHLLKEHALLSANIQIIGAIE